MNDFTLDFVQQALRHEEMKQTETFRRSSEAESTLSGVTERNKPRGPPTRFESGEVGYMCRHCTTKKSKGHKARPG